jgi:hypothetical protein
VNGDEFLWLPYINIVLGLVGLFWLIIRTAHRWNEYPSEVRLLLVVTIMFVFALIETSAETIVHGDDATSNMFVVGFVKLFLLYTLWKTGTALYRTGTRTVDDGLGRDDADDPDRDIIA